MKLNYCVNCLLPSTKPNIIFDENGFCQACIYHRSKSNKKFGIDWNEREKDFIVLAGNPSQKFSNDELDNMCKPYLKLISDTPTRNEYRYIARRTHINVGLYDNDSYGGTAWRECIDLGCMPLSIRMYEYKAILEKINYEWICKEDFSDIKRRIHELINFSKQYSKVIDDTVVFENDFGLRKEILERCSYEHTTKNKMKKIDLL